MKKFFYTCIVFLGWLVFFIAGCGKDNDKSNCTVYRIAADDTIKIIYDDSARVSKVVFDEAKNRYYEYKYYGDSILLYQPKDGMIDTTTHVFCVLHLNKNRTIRLRVFPSPFTNDTTWYLFDKSGYLITTVNKDESGIDSNSHVYQNGNLHSVKQNSRYGPVTATLYEYYPVANSNLCIDPSSFASIIPGVNKENKNLLHRIRQYYGDVEYLNVEYIYDFKAGNEVNAEIITWRIEPGGNRKDTIRKKEKIRWLHTCE